LEEDGERGEDGIGHVEALVAGNVGVEHFVFVAVDAELFEGELTR
jgi:hypothetical protein